MHGPWKISDTRATVNLAELNTNMYFHEGTRLIIESCFDINLYNNQSLTKGLARSMNANHQMSFAINHRNDWEKKIHDKEARGNNIKHIVAVGTTLQWPHTKKLRKTKSILIVIDLFVLSVGWRVGACARVYYLGTLAWEHRLTLVTTSHIVIGGNLFDTFICFNLLFVAIVILLSRCVRHRWTKECQVKTERYFGSCGLFMYATYTLSSESLVQFMFFPYIITGLQIMNRS